MASIEYITLDGLGSDAVGPLWLKLQEHHRLCSQYFPDCLQQVSWEQRRESLVRKACDNTLRIDMARDAAGGRYVGYCLTSLSAELRGEIESIYIEVAYRRQGIGEALMRRALEWLDTGGAKVKVLGVAVGNEEVFGFYRRFGFLPRTTILQQRPELRGPQ